MEWKAFQDTVGIKSANLTFRPAVRCKERLQTVMCCLKLFVRLYLTYTYILGNFSVTSKADVSEPSSIIAKLKVGENEITGKYF